VPAEEQNVRRTTSLGLRGRVLAWYVLLLAIALAISSILLFKAATIYQEDVAEQKLREEVFDFEAALAGRAPGEAVHKAVRAHLDHWPGEDREALVVRLTGLRPKAAGPVGPEPGIVRALEQGSNGRFLSLETRAGDARVLTAPITISGRVVGSVAAVHLTEEDRDYLHLALATVLIVAVVALLVASLIAWISVGHLLRPLKEIAATADAISREGDLVRTIPESGRKDEVGVLGASFNRMLVRLDAAFRRERRFLSEASHELRTPITICRGHLEVLGPKPKPEELRETIDIVIDELARLGRIVEEMTTLARVDDPEFLRPRQIALDDFIEEVGVKAETLLDGRLAVERPPSGSIVSGDPQRLTQALLNLLDNAAVHGDDGARVELRVVAERDVWKFEVADEAGGVPEGQEESLFRPFRRGKTRAVGRGLGLAIVTGIAEAHRGSAGVDNRPGKGATFWIRVPK
jgi:two-component system, OmpR family, sensor kinase